VLQEGVERLAALAMGFFAAAMLLVLRI